MQQQCVPDSMFCTYGLENGFKCTVILSRQSRDAVQKQVCFCVFFKRIILERFMRFMDIIPIFSQDSSND